MTARDEILAAIPAVASSDGTFTIDQMIRELRSRGSSFAPSTIRTHVSSRMCANAPDNHATTYADLVRVAPSLYRPSKAIHEGNGRGSVP